MYKDLVDPASTRIVDLHYNTSIIYENRWCICINIFYLFPYSNDKNLLRVKGIESYKATESTVNFSVYWKYFRSLAKCVSA